MMLYLFIPIGEYIKRFCISKTVYILCTFLYVIFEAFLSFYFKEYIGVTFIIFLKWRTVIFLLPLAITGSIMVLGISKILKKNRFLEYIGRNSLPIFLLHTIILIKILDKTKEIISNCPQQGELLWIALLCSTLIITLIIVFILNLKQLKWILGKW